MPGDPATAYLRSLIPRPGDGRAGPSGLERMRSLLRGLEDPQAGRRFVHVGGTAGKGSTATCLARILQAAGLRTGLHVSPHVVDAGERAQVDGAGPGPDEFATLVAQVREVAEAMDPRPSYFEALLAVALLRFRAARTDVDVVEVGLGGRLDATNVLDSGHQVITNVGLEHVGILGDTPAAILREKREILRPGSTVVTGLLDPGLRAVLDERAAALGCDVAHAGRNFDWQAGAGTWAFREGAVALQDLPLAPPVTGMAANAALAVAMARRLGCGEDAVRDGLGRTVLPGRLEVVARDPLTIFDGAHNPLKARWLVDGLREAFPGRRFATVLRFRDRPDIWETLRLVSEVSDHVVLTRSAHAGDMGVDPAYDRAALERARREHGATHAEPPAAALARATALARRDGLGVLVTGSIYLLQELRTHAAKGSPEPHL